MVISHEKEATKRLFAAVRFFVENMEVKPAVSIDSKTEIRFHKRDSNYFVGTAGQKAFGRGDTVSRAHLSEAAFYEDLQRILTGISEAAEYGQIDVETTANGRGDFYDMWIKAKAGKSAYTPIFIPWFIDTEYSLQSMTEDERQGLSAGVREMFDIPDSKFELTQEEREMMKRVKAEWGFDLTIGQMKWRRYKIWDKGQLFFQEYPEDDVSCFLQSGRSVFNQITCDPSRRIPLDNLNEWKASSEEKAKLKKRRLYGGVDGSEGTLTGDANCFSVIDIQNGKGVVIYEYTSNEPLDYFDAKVARICKQFNIVLGVEKNGVGTAHCKQFEAHEVAYEAWDTTAASRPVMITDLEEAYRKGDLIETYPEAENEARDMEYKENNRAEHKKGKHDDRVFSRAIAWQMRQAPTAGVTFL